jgi:hypothetical protein
MAVSVDVGIEMSVAVGISVGVAIAVALSMVVGSAVRVALGVAVGVAVDLAVAPPDWQALATSAAAISTAEILKLLITVFPSSFLGCLEFVATRRDTVGSPTRARMRRCPSSCAGSRAP